MKKTKTNEMSFPVSIGMPVWAYERKTKFNIPCKVVGLYCHKKLNEGEWRVQLEVIKNGRPLDLPLHSVGDIILLEEPVA